MSTPFLGEIRIFAGSYAPRGWGQCVGTILPINQNQGLFSILSTTYGGNGTTNFALPDLRGRVPMHFDGGSFSQGQSGGSATHTLALAEMPAHQHTLQAVTAAGTQRSLSGNMLGATPFELYGSATPSGSLASTSVSIAGGGTSHTNVQPYAVVLFAIALQGLFPSQT